MRPGISIVITSIPERGVMLADALMTAATQSRKAAAIIVAVDTEREGAGPTRDRGLSMVTTSMVAFLDDDDLLDTNHLELLMDCMEETGADLVYPWHRVLGGNTDFLTTMLDGELVSPFGVTFGQEQADWLRLRNFIPTPVLARTELAQQCTFVCEPTWWNIDGEIVSADDPTRFARAFTEEWKWQLQMLDLGAKFVHLPKRTWSYRHHGANTSGLPENIQ